MVQGKVQRSHHGCARCKRRRQKCDETRPQCGRCRGAGTACDYVVTLKWDGRVNRRQGQEQQTSKRHMAERESRADDLAPCVVDVGPSGGSPALATKTDNRAVEALSVVRDVDPLSWLSSTSRALLYHYVNSASHVTSCHAQVQAKICGLIIPMALETPSLLYATVALSALHRSTVQEDSFRTFRLDNFISGTMASSLQHLRQELSAGTHNRYALLATVRTLCICEIHSGRADPGSWRVHVEGAKALLESIRGGRNDQERVGSAAQWLIDRWYSQIESLTALTTLRGLSKGQLERYEPPALPDSASHDAYLDTYVGYTPALNPFFREIGAAAWERRRIDSLRDTQSILSNTDLDEEADCLEASIRSMLARPILPPTGIDGLSPAEASDFAAVNEAFHYTALLHLQRRVRKLATTSPQIQELVRKLLACVQRVTPKPGLSPWVVLTTPIFTAGCEALGGDRDIVRGLLRALYATIKIRNVLRSLDILETIWSGDCEDGIDRWEDLLTGHNEPDFIPY